MKLANFYFLVIAILQMIPGLSTTGSYTTGLPLLFFVALSMAKEGWTTTGGTRWTRRRTAAWCPCWTRTAPRPKWSPDGDAGGRRRAWFKRGEKARAAAAGRRRRAGHGRRGRSARTRLRVGDARPRPVAAGPMAGPAGRRHRPHPPRREHPGRHCPAAGRRAPTASPTSRPWRWTARRT